MMNNEFENNPNPQNDIPQPTFTPAPDFEESAARAEEVAACLLYTSHMSYIYHQIHYSNSA